MSIKKIWRKREYNEKFANELEASLNISSTLASILSSRGIIDVDNAQKFILPLLKDMREPFSFKDMQKAITRIMHAITQDKVIGIFGDYDVDGVSSTALLTDFFNDLQVSCVNTLPHRASEGYGLSIAGIDRLLKKQASLIICVDCGSNDAKEISYANEKGVDVIVIDHHNITDDLPNAHAIVNPKQPGCTSKASFLCAAGVSFFLVCALRRELRNNGYFKKGNEPDITNYLDLVSLATVCDVVPLIHENRAFVQAGLKKIKHGQRAGLDALIDEAMVKKDKISSTNLGFHLGPRINAAGRLTHADFALDLLTTKNKARALELASLLNNENSSRQALEKAMVEKVSTMINESATLKSAKVIVVHDESFHPGVVGIVASRIAETFYKPAIIIGKGGKGSGRSIKGIDLYMMVNKAKSTLEGFGGHSHAIGLTLGKKGVTPFYDNLAMVFEDVSKEVYRKEILYDVELNLNDINLDIIDELRRLEPFGAHNPYPVIRLDDIYFRNLRNLNGGHVKGEIEGKGASLSFIGFRMSIDDDHANSHVSILGILERNEWRGNINAQLRLIDYKKSPV